MTNRLPGMSDVLDQKEGYLVFVKYEEWRLEGERNTISEAVQLREETLKASGGAETLLLRRIPILQAYRDAEYEMRERARKEKEANRGT